MRRKAAREQLDSIARLRAKLRSSRGEIARPLARRPAAPRRAAGAYGPVFEHLDAELAAADSDLAATEDAYGVERPRPTQLRCRRENATDELHALHAALQGVLGRTPQPECAGLVAKTPRSRRALTELAARTVEVLRRLEGVPLVPVFGVTIKAGLLAADFETARRRLELSLAELDAAETAVVFAREEAERAFARTHSVVS